MFGNCSALSCSPGVKSLRFLSSIPSSFLHFEFLQSYLSPHCSTLNGCPNFRHWSTNSSGEAVLNSNMSK